MKVRFLLYLIIIISLMAMPSAGSFAADGKSGADILKSGLLGAGAGAVGGAASGAKGGELWKGALAGAGVNLVGEALLDSMTGEKVREVREVDSVSPRNAYTSGYEDAYENAYKKGYTDGYDECFREFSKKYKKGKKFKKSPPPWAPAHGYRAKQ